MEELVKHILAVASENNKKITQLQLHKISYFSIGYLIRENHEEIAENLYLDEYFEAWKYGPVLIKTYEKYKKYHSTPILDNGEISNRLSSLNNFNDMILHLINTNVFDLVTVSHRNNFWIKNKNLIDKNKKPKYTFNDLKGDFKHE